MSFIISWLCRARKGSAPAASFAVSLGLRLGMPDDEPLARQLFIDTIGGNLTRATLGRVEECPCCGRYADEPRLLASRRQIQEWPADWESDATVVASEPILVSYRVDGKETVVFESASNFDSSFPETLASDPGIVDLEIRDQFSIVELGRRFSGRSMPGKFALVIGASETLVYEFMETLR